MVIDSNVIAYALLGPAGRRDAARQALQYVDEIAVPDLFFAEYAGVVWQWATQLEASLPQFLGAMDDAEGLVERVVPCRSLWRSALGTALQVRHSVYDGMYVALARSLRSRVLTFDARLMAAFPHDTVSALEYAESGGRQ